ncbi:hypothetical protein AAC387_Pa11g0540 [Persea americana]
MEGLIPYVYRAIVQYRTSGQAQMAGSWYCESPSAAYMRLPGDSGRFQTSDIFRPERVFSSSSSMAAPSSNTQVLTSTATQSPLRRSVSRRPQ